MSEETIQGLKHKSTDPVSIQEILDDIFYIPSYQRGYRWSIQQVKELLEDIEEFCEKGSNGIYCIQPLVVNHNNEKWNVVDGQQRLTTISILLSCLGMKKYILEYQTREKSVHFLESILVQTERNAYANIDFYHMIKARDYILQWINSKDKSFINDYKETLLNKVKFIWYDIGSQDPIEVFTRLNIDKIPLTSAELIKAILLNRTNYSQEEDYERIRFFQQELSSQWDEMESLLSNDEFWLFFHDDDLSIETRIDYILELICDYKMLGKPLEDIGTDQSRVFRYFYTYFQQNKYSQDTLHCVWEKIRMVYSTLHEWYSDLELYHYIGYLMARPKESTRQKGNYVTQQKLLCDFLNKWNEPGMTIGIFKNYLLEQINEILNDCRDLEKEYETKGSPKTQCRPILLLHNIESTIQQGRIAQRGYNQTIFNKFPFNLYKKERWDVEHIDSSTTNSLTEYNAQKEWLLANYIIAAEEQKEAIKAFCEKMQEEDDDLRNQTFNDLMAEILPVEDADNKMSEREKNMVWNFTLLNEGTNRGYKNAIFPAKRRMIIGKEQGVFYPVPIFNREKGFVQPIETESTSAFIPICTKQVFMKYYSPESSSMALWTKEDAIAYRRNIYRVLSEKFNIKG